MTILLALADDPEKAGYSLVRGRADVDPATGDNFFEEDPKGPHAFVVRQKPVPWFEENLNSWLRSESDPTV